MKAEALSKMSQIVARIKRQAEQAQEKFDAGAEKLQITSNQSINLFGGTATSQVADIAVDARRICDELYATLQMLVRMADKECRPLLSQQPSLFDVRDVAELIKWLNSESEIGANFSASLNSKKLGNVVSGRYIPTMESKMIQSYWETKYDTWADWVCDSGTQVNHVVAPAAITPNAEKKGNADSPVLRTLLDASKRQDFTLTEEELAFKRAYNRWQDDFAEAEKRREEEIERRIASVRKQIEIPARVKYEETVAAQTKIQQDAKQQISDAQAKIASTNFFQFSIRNAQQIIINNAQQAYERATSALSEAKNYYDREVARAEQVASQKNISIRKEVFNTFQMPEPPKTPASIVTLQSSNLAFRRALVQGMESGVMYTINDMRREFPVTMGLTTQRVAALVKQMIPDQLERIEKDGKAYFRAIK